MDFELNQFISKYVLSEETLSRIPLIYWKSYPFCVECAFGQNHDWLQSAPSTEHWTPSMIHCTDKIMSHQFREMNSHKNKMNWKTFRNVFFNCHHFIRFGFVSHWHCTLHWHCTIHGTSELNNNNMTEAKTVCYGIANMSKWLCAYENKFT